MLNSSKNQCNEVKIILNPAAIEPSSFKLDLDRTLRNNPIYRNHKSLCDLLIKQILKGHPQLGTNKKYTLRQICGESFWQKLEGNEPNLAGTFVGTLVTRKQLPLRHAGTNRSNHKQYYLH